MKAQAREQDNVQSKERGVKASCEAEDGEVARDVEPEAIPARYNAPKRYYSSRGGHQGAGGDSRQVAKWHEQAQAGQ